LALTLATCTLRWFATASLFAAEATSDLAKHMIVHVLLMFAVPVGLIASGSARALLWTVPVSWRRSLLRAVPRRAVTWRGPTVGFLALNVVMVVALVPRVFDAIMTSDVLRVWILEPAFVASGLVFFHFLIAAAPRHVRTRLRFQAAMVIATMFEMLVLAMSMSIFTKSAWYSSMAATSDRGAQMGMSSDPSALFHQQQLAAAILWICGDLWAVPLLVLIVRRVAKRDGSLLAAMDQRVSVASSSR
jgi:cytochrome c oxidase assembly factor CtaG